MKLSLMRAKEMVSDHAEKRRLNRELGEVLASLNREPNNLETLERQAHLRESLGVTRDTIAAYRELGSAYIRKDLHERAIAAYKRILEIAPDQPGIHGELAELIKKHEAEQWQSQLDAEQRSRTKKRASSALFNLFETDALEEILASTCMRYFEHGETIFEEGQPGSSLYVTVEGEIEAFTRDGQGGVARLPTIKAGDLFGENSVISAAPRAETTVVRKQAILIEVSRQRIEEIAQRHPHVLDVLQRFCEQRAEAAIEAIVRRKPVRRKRS